MDHSSNKYEWFALGDVNGFFGLMFDNLTVLSFLAGTLVFVFKFPADIVYSKMFPGTAFGVLVGDLVYTWMAFRLSKRTGSRAVTAMPLGLDTPSTIGMALVVLGPAFVALKAEGMTRTRCRDHDLVHRHGHDGHDRHPQGGLLLHRPMGPAGRSAGRPPGLAGRHRPGADRSCAAGGCLRHAGDWDAVAGADSLFSRGACPAAGQLSQCARRDRSGHRHLLRVRAHRLDGRHVRRTTIGRSPFWPSDPNHGFHERVRPRPQIPADHHSIRPVDGYRRHQRDREFARGRGRLRHEKHPADGGDRHGDRRNLWRRGAINPVHRPARVQTDGRPGRLHPVDRAFYRTRRHARLRLLLCRADSPRCPCANPDLRRARHRRRVVPGMPAAARSRGRLRLLSHHRAGCSPSNWKTPRSSRPRLSNGCSRRQANRYPKRSSSWRSGTDSS